MKRNNLSVMSVIMGIARCILVNYLRPTIPQKGHSEPNDHW